MNHTTNKTGVAVLGLALAVSAVGGVAVASDAGDWYTGNKPTVADSNRTNVGLKLYDAAGTEVTSGPTTALPAFVAADSTVRTGDTFASLFVHLPQTSTAPGAWPGIQATGTDRWSGTGAVSGAGSLAGKPRVRTAAGHSLADIVKSLPNTEGAASFAGVYELRLRTSSTDAGVSDEYASAYVKVTGSTWSVTSAPILGSDPTTPTPVATSVAAAWPGSLTWGKAGTVTVTVKAASGTTAPQGTVTLRKGSTTLATGTLGAGGRATLTLSRTALQPGSHTLSVAYAGSGTAFKASRSATRSITVGKASASRPTVKVTTKATARKAGTVKVTVKAPSGLTAATGRVTLTLKKGGSPKKVTGTLKSGVVTLKLPKVKAGTWKATANYAGDARYLKVTSTTVKVKVAKK